MIAIDRRRSHVFLFAFILSTLTLNVFLFAGFWRNPSQVEDGAWQNRLQVSPSQVLDLGRLPCRSSNDFRLQLLNHSDDSIRLTHLHTSCGCTGAQLSSEDLSPRGAVELAGTLRASSASGKFQVGIDVVCMNERTKETCTKDFTVTYVSYEVLQTNVTDIVVRPNPGQPDPAVERIILTNAHHRPLNVQCVADIPAITLIPSTFSLLPGAQRPVDILVASREPAANGIVTFGVTATDLDFKNTLTLRVSPMPRFTINPRVINLSSLRQPHVEVEVQSASSDLEVDVLGMPDDFQIVATESKSPGVQNLRLRVFPFQKDRKSSRYLELGLRSGSDPSWTENASIPIIGTIDCDVPGTATND